MDVTRQQELENQLRESQKMEAIGTLAGGIAHDFNNILSAITGYPELSLFKSDQKQHIQSSMKKILSASDRAKELINQILTFSRKNELSREVQNISNIVIETLNLIEITAPKGVKIEKNVDPFCYAEVNAGQIRQVILNLCTNAFQAMKKSGGTLKLQLVQDKKYKGAEERSFIQIKVKDTGEGIEEKIIDRIFEPYFTTKSQEDGAGLGLSVTHGIINSHKGFIKCESFLNRGTTFTIWIPQSPQTPYKTAKQYKVFPVEAI